MRTNRLALIPLFTGLFILPGCVEDLEKLLESATSTEECEDCEEEDSEDEEHSEDDEDRDDSEDEEEGELDEDCEDAIDALLDQVWGTDIAVTARTIDTHLKRLREKLGPAGDLIETVRGVGYRFAE